jgi:NADPH:quinone reductase-like Zn-dependent oxidoreductase
LRVRVAQAFDLTEAAEAHRVSESRKANGKLVLLVG